MKEEEEGVEMEGQLMVNEMLYEKEVQVEEERILMETDEMMMMIPNY